MSVLAREDVVKPLAHTATKERLGDREPLRLYTAAFVALIMVLFTVVVITLGDQKGAAILVGVVGVIMLGAIQMVVLRKKLFSPSTVADVIKAFVGQEGLKKVVDGKGDEVAKPADPVQR